MGIVMLELQTSQQPLIAALGEAGPLKAAYNQACDDILVSNSGICIIITHIPKIVANVFFKEAVNALKATGIEPIDSLIFRD